MAELAKNLNFDTRGQKGSPSLFYTMDGLSVDVLCYLILHYRIVYILSI